MAGKIKVIGVDIWECSAQCLCDGIPESILIKPELVMESCMEHYL